MRYFQHIYAFSVETKVTPWPMKRCSKQTHPNAGGKNNCADATKKGRVQDHVADETKAIAARMHLIELIYTHIR